jgi:hypothetical protein
MATSVDQTDRRVKVEGRWGYVGVEDDGVVDFLTRHGKDDAVMDVIVSGMKWMMTSMGRYREEDRREMKESAVLEYLRGMEESLKGSVAMGSASMVTRVAEQEARMVQESKSVKAGIAEMVKDQQERERVDRERADRERAHAASMQQERAKLESERAKMESERLTAVLEQQQGMIGGMMERVEGVVGKALERAMERVGVEEFARAVSRTVSEEMKAVKEGQKEERVALRDTEARLRGWMKTDVLEPLAREHAKASADMRVIPAQMDEVCTRIVASRTGELTSEVTVMHGQVKAVMGMMERVMAGQVLETESRANAVEVTDGFVRRVLAETTHMWEGVSGWEKRMPEVLRGLLNDAMGDAEERVNQMREQATSVRAQLSKMDAGIASMSEVKLELSGAASRLEGVAGAVMAMQTRKVSHSQAKGMVGERRMYDMLCDRLPAHDRYEVRLVTGQTHCCDIAIKRVGYPDVMVECKAYGEQTGSKVGMSEVSKFRRDLGELQTHGIFVSLHSGITGMNRFHMEQMPTGKFAVYLGENEYDMDVIYIMLLMLYKLDGVVSASERKEEGGSQGISVTPEVMMQVQMMMGDMMNKVKTVTASMRQNINMLNEITLDIVVQMLMGNVIKQQAIAPPIVQPLKASTSRQKRKQPIVQPIAQPVNDASRQKRYNGLMVFMEEKMISYEESVELWKVMDDAKKAEYIKRAKVMNTSRSAGNP